MPATPDTTKHPAASVTPTSPWRVSKIRVERGYRLSVTFVDGTSGTVDMSRLIGSDGAGVFAALRDRKLFAKAHIEYGAVTWPGGVDLAPDAMYDSIRTTGRWDLGPD